MERRTARLDLSSYSAAEARAALAEARPAIEAEVRRHLRFLLDSSLEESDLRAIAEVAVLEARITWTDGRGRTLRSWVGRTIRWRLSEAVQNGHSAQEMPLEEPDKVINGHNPEATVERVRDIQWVRTAVARLDPRHRVLMTARMDGETQRHTASTLGISEGRVSQEVHRAFEILRQRAEDDGMEVGE